MTNESTFLIRFGLHHYVGISRHNGKSHFSVDGNESQIMIEHAKNIINEMFGAPSVVCVK